ncbi:MAG: hypothetical protein ACQ5SW_00480 [Sphaerochaetaceae bacterium]
MLHRLQKGYFRILGASRQVQQYWWKQLKRWSHGKSLNLDPQEIERHLRGRYHLPVSGSLCDRVVGYAVGEGPPYLPFALSTKVPFD